MPEIEFWYEFASTYSYPAAMRIERLAQAAGVTVRWRPFLLGPIFAAQGWTDSPFNLYPAKGRYMWRDLERICALEEIPLKLPPARFPQNGLKAARLALAGEADGWTADFTRAVYTANFAQQKDISDDTTLTEVLKGLSIDAERAFAAANTAANKDRLKAQTADTRHLRRSIRHRRRRVVLGQRPAAAGDQPRRPFARAEVTRLWIALTHANLGVMARECGPPSWVLRDGTRFERCFRRRRRSPCHLGGPHSRAMTVGL